MFRLFKAELKKIFLKPSIFVVTGLIILMLAVSIFIYKPATKDEEYVEYPSTLTTVNDYYNYFNTNTAYNARIATDDLLVQAEAYLDYYSTNQNTVEKLKNDWQAVRVIYSGSTSEPYASYINAYDRYNATKNNPSSTETEIQTAYNQLVNKRNELKSAIENFTAEYTGYVNNEAVTFLVTPELDHEIYNEYLIQMIGYFNNADAGSDNTDLYILNNLKSSQIFDKIANDLNKLLKFEPDTDYVNSLYDYVNQAKERNTALLQEIQNYNYEKQSSTTDEDKEGILKLITDYYLNASYAKNIVVKGVQISGISKYTATNITKYKNFQNTNVYELKESYTKFKYLFDNETYKYNFADPFSIIQPSNTNLNGFDYSFFALRLCAFFITIYIVVLAAGTIAGEQSSGTLKLLAIRPYGRHKLLSAKIYATLSIGAILMFVTSIASLVVGGITYGFSSLPILAVFNASSAFVIHPILLYLISMLTMLLEVMFYAMISIFISTVFKSNVAAVAISILLFFVSLVLNIIAVNIPWLGLIPFVNVNLFKYFGASFVSNFNGTNLLQTILTPTVFAGSTFWSSVIIYLITFTAITIGTHAVFKKRDIK